MIYEAMVKKSIVEESVDTTELDTFLTENEDRFEYNTIAEATMIIIEEQEINWNRFMQGIGFEELGAVMEGTEIIYEGARLTALINKAKAFFDAALKKLKEITASFMKKVDELAAKGSGFLKKYEDKIKGATFPSDYKIKGYKFGDLSTPVYNLKHLELAVKSDAETVAAKDKKEFDKSVAEKDIFGGELGDKTLLEALEKAYYGEGKVEITSVNPSEQVNIVKGTKNMKGQARDSYAKAKKAVQDIIKMLKRIEKEADKGSNMEKACNMLITFGKSYSSAITVKHSCYMRALSARHRQALSICVAALGFAAKAEREAKKAEKDAKKEEKKAEPKNEGFVNTEGFLGSVEFI